MDWKLSGVIKKIQDLYSERSSTIASYFKASRERQAAEKMKYELINFAMSLRIKGEDELAKLYLLDTVVKEADPENRGLRQLSETERLTFKLRNQVLVTCKDTPRDVTISQYQVEKLETLQNEFELLYRLSTFLEFALRKFNDGDFLASYQGLKTGIEYPGASQLGMLQQYREFSGILVLRICTLINQHLFSQSKDTISWVRHLGMIVVALIPKEAIHYRQVTHNLEHSRDRIPEVAQVEEGKEMTVAFEEVISNLMSTKLVDTLGPENLPTELQETILKASQFSAYPWLEGWKPDFLATRLAEETTKLKTKKNEIWLEMNTRMLQFKSMISDTQRIENEKKIGVYAKPRS